MVIAGREAASPSCGTRRARGPGLPAVIDKDLTSALMRTCRRRDDDDINGRARTFDHLGRRDSRSGESPLADSGNYHAEGHFRPAAGAPQIEAWAVPVLEAAGGGSTRRARSASRPRARRGLVF